MSLEANVLGGLVPGVASIKIVGIPNPTFPIPSIGTDMKKK